MKLSIVEKYDIISVLLIQNLSQYWKNVIYWHCRFDRSVLFEFLFFPVNRFIYKNLRNDEALTKT